jgi:hypothetical protein
VAIAWFTTATSDGQAFVAFSDDAGRTFSQPIRVDDEAATGHVDVELLTDGSAAVSWTELVDERSTLKVRRVAQNGDRSPAVRVAQVSSLDYPRMSHAEGELLLAWTEKANGGSAVHTARIAIPAALGPAR